MTDTTIANLPAGAPAEPTDQIPIARGGANYSLTAQSIANLATGNGFPGVPAYGSATNAMQINNGSGAFGATNFYGNYIVGGPNNSQDFYNSLNWFNGTPQEFPWFSGSSSTIVELVDPYTGNSNSLTVGYLYGSTTNANAGLSIQSGTYNDGNNWVFDVANSYPSQLFLSSTGGTVPALTFWTSSTAGVAGDTVPFVQSLAVDKDGGMFLGAATGGSQGVGTINATAYYVDGASIYSYGQFLSENTQTVVSVGDAQSITFTGSSGTADITLVDSSKITFANPGVYLVAASVVTNDTVGGNALVYWVNKNNTPITDSATVCGQPIGGLLLTSACTYVVTTTTAGDYIEMVMTGQATTNEITATPAGTVGAASPLSPSIIVTVNKVG